MSISMSSRIPIAQLAPSLESPNDYSVHGIITLVWPYSSSTQSYSLLLVEPDFRLRRHRGQVRVHFQGSSAKAVASVCVNSGDALVLSLQGASWEKDPTSSTTPGRGIEWELVFGEYVVLEIQRSGQSPIPLAIDHPPASLEAPNPASSPHSYPSSDDHLPRSTRKRLFSPKNDDRNTWSSPAFLKRSRFASSSFDPFAELEEDFPGNERKKKSKFGRGRGEWRFVGNTPSPEKDEVAGPVFTSSSSPTSEKQVEAVQGHGQQSMLATPPVDVAPPISEDIEPPNVKSASVARESDKMNLERAEPSSTGPDTINKVFNQPSHENALPEHDEQLILQEWQKEQTSGSEPVLVETEKKAIEISSRKSSPSIISSSSQTSEAESENSADEEHASDSVNEAMWSGSASEFGLDGTVMSRLRQTAQASPMASEIGRRWVEMQEAASSVHNNRPSFEAIEDKELEAPHEKAPIRDDVLRPQSEPDQPTNEARGEPNGISSLSDQQREPLKQSTDEALVSKFSGEDVQMGDAENHESTAMDVEWFKVPDFPEQAMRERGESAKDVAGQHDGHETSDLEQFKNLAKEVSLINDNPSERESHSPLEKQKSVAVAEPSIEMEDPRVEIIDLESEDEKDSQQHPATSVGPSSTFRRYGDLNHDDTESLSQGDESTMYAIDVPDERGPRSEIASPESEARESEVNEKESERDQNSPSLMEERSPTGQKEKIKVLREKRRVHSAESPDDIPPLAISSEPIAPRKMTEDARLAIDLAPTDLSTNTTASLPQQDLPSVVQDTYEGPFESQFLTQNDSQYVDPSVREASTLSTLSPPADESMSPPESAQVSSARAASLDLKDPRQIDQHAGQDQPFEEVAIDKQAATRGVSAEQPPVEAPVEMEGAQQERPAPEASLSRRSSPRFKPETPVSNALGQESSISKGGSTLIARLKEMRRISSQIPGRQPSGNSASRWFAPRRSSTTLPENEAERHAHIASPPHARDILIKTPTKDIHTTPEKRLSQSFVRSSPLQSALSKSPTPSLQESQYLPPSQVAMGFRTSLSYFVPLTSLHTHYGTTVDVLAVAMSGNSVTRAKTGPKDYNQTIYLTDPSSATGKIPPSLTIAQIFRPRKSCFPIIDLGDAILLRNFKVHSFQKALSLISTDASAWAIFRKDADVQIPGPPVEYGPEERAFARAHWNWWGSLDADVRDGLVAAVPKAKSDRARKGLGFELPSSQSQQRSKSSKSKNEMPPAPSKGELPETNSSLDLAEVKQESQSATPGRRVLRPRNARGQEKDTLPEMEEIHQLRDGTRYVDRKGVGVKEVETQTGVHELRDGTRYRDQTKK